jgi:hypothetical protein
MGIEDVFDGEWLARSAVLVLLKVSKLWGSMKQFAGKGGEEDDYEHHYLTACTSSSCREPWGAANNREGWGWLGRCAAHGRARLQQP